MVFSEPGWWWMPGIYLDQTPYKVFMKSVQCGITEYAQTWVMAQLFQGFTGPMVFPDNVKRDDYVKDRFNNLISRVPVYARAIRDTNTNRVKHIGKATIYFLGSNMPKDFESFTAQWYVVDEKDSCNPETLRMLNDRVSASRKLTGRDAPFLLIANPRAGQHGIAADFEESKKFEWNIRCDHCDKWQPLSWLDNVVRQIDDAHYVLRAAVDDGGEDIPCLCRHCEKPIDRLKEGVWVAEYPDRTVSGYHITQLFTDQYSIRRLFNMFDKALVSATALQHFYNSYLGLPYTSGEDQLTYDILQACAGDYVMPKVGKGTVAGIDVGKVFHVRIDELIDGRRKAVFVGICRSVEDLVRTFRRYGVTTYVMDADPEQHTARDILKKIPGGFRCRYNPNERATGMKIDRSDRLITINRTESIDEMVQAYYQQLVLLPKNFGTIPDFVSHMTAPVRYYDDGSLRNKSAGERKIYRPPRYVWDEQGRPDHLFHADNYCHMAAKLRGFGKRSYEIRWF